MVVCVCICLCVSACVREREREKERERENGYVLYIYIYIYMAVQNVRIGVNHSRGRHKAPFSIATTPRCRGGRYSFHRIHISIYIYI